MAGLVGPRRASIGCFGVPVACVGLGAWGLITVRGMQAAEVHTVVGERRSTLESGLLAWVVKAGIHFPSCENCDCKLPSMTNPSILRSFYLLLGREGESQRERSELKL